MSKRDLVILGGGAGGLVVASVAAQLGRSVTLIEKADRLGGDCLHYGCVPSKTLIRSAQVAALMRRGAEFGLEPCDFPVDLARVNAHVKSVVDHIQHHDDPERFRGYGCEVLLGEAAQFVSPHEIRVGERVIHGRRFVIATGTHPFVPDIPGLHEAPYSTNEDLFSLQDLPPRLAVLGGGAIGVELGQALVRLGSEVTLLQRGPQILPREDPELVVRLAESLHTEGMRIHTNTTVDAIHTDVEGSHLHCSGGLRLTVDHILIATGRQPNIEELGLDAAGVAHTRRGIVVDRRQRTSQKHIYACGDVCGPYAFTHMAEHQAGVVISNAVFRFPKKTNYRVVPWVTYSDPELARVGLTEVEAREQGIDPEVLRFEFRDVDRAITANETTGLYKLVTHRGRILGASILGPHAGELLHEIVLAMQTGVKIGAISATIHAYPTLAQVHRRVVNTAYAAKLFSPLTRRLVKWIHHLLPG